jgi:hypothetical protein
VIGINMGLSFGRRFPSSDPPDPGDEAIAVTSLSAGAVLYPTIEYVITGTCTEGVGVITAFWNNAELGTATRNTSTTWTYSFTPAWDHVVTANGLGGAAFSVQGLVDGSDPVTGSVTVLVYSPLLETSVVSWINLRNPAGFTESAGAITGVVNLVSSVTWADGTLPDYSATGINSRPAMVLNGTSHWVGSTEAAAVAALTDSPPYTALAVAQASAAAVAAIIGAGASGVASNRTREFGTSNSSGGLLRTVADDDAVGNSLVSNSSAVSLTSAPFVGTWHSAGDPAVNIRHNGTLVGSTSLAGTVGTLTPTRIALGCRPDSVPDRFFGGAIGESITFSAEKNSAAIARLEAYLFAGWGITP